MYFPTTVGRQASNLFLFALFPAFFLYQLGAAAGLYPMFLGQWWSIWNIFGAAVFVALACFNRPGFWGYDAALLGVVGLVALYAAYFALLGDEVQSGRIPLEESVKLILGWTCLYGVGLFLKLDGKFHRGAFICWALISATTVLLMDAESLSFIASERFSAPEVATYQWFAQAFVVTAMVALASSPHRWTRALIAGVSLPVAFILSSRSDLLGLACVLAVWALIRLVRRPKRIATLFMAAATLVTGSLCILAYSEFLKDHSAAPTTHGEVAEPQNRQLELLDPASSGSVIERMKLLNYGLADIQESPIMGKYAGQMHIRGSFGDYVHNILSAWHNYGIFVFIVFVGLTISSAALSARKVIWLSSDDARWQLALYLSVYSLVGVIVSKSIYWPLPALSWGLVSALVAVDYTRRKAIPPAINAPATVAATSIS